MNNKVNECPSEVTILLGRWLKLYRWWWGMHYLLGLTGIVSAAIGAISVGENPLVDSESAKVLFGLLATVSASVITFLGPIQKAERYYSSYHILDQACCDMKVGNIDQTEFSAKQSYARSLLCSNLSGQNDAVSLA